MAFRVSRRRDVNVMRVGVKVITTVVALYASGYMLTIMGTIMNGTCSPFYVGLRLIGWSVSTDATSHYCTDVSAAAINTIYATSGTGILSIIGLLAMIWIIFEFVNVQM